MSSLSVRPHRAPFPEPVVDLHRHSLIRRAWCFSDTPTQGGGTSKNSLNRHPSGCPLDFDRLTEGQLMPLSSILQDQSSKRLTQGAATGAIVTMIVGFDWGGWSLEGTTAKRADEASRNAVVAVLAPICVDKFQHSRTQPIIFSNSRKCRPICKAVSSKRAVGRLHRAATRLTLRSPKRAPPCWEI